MIIVKHILPNTLAPLTVQATYICASAMITESILSFIGAGTPPIIPSWGNIMAEGRARSLSLDLVGLPPTPEEVRRFAGDPSESAYEREVERLLASPHFGERMAVPWLDAVRYADTVGYHGDQNQRIFPYRDYVIAAFNANKPFDLFTVEQLAGDLLPEPSVEQQVATGFIVGVYEHNRILSW